MGELQGIQAAFSALAAFLPGSEEPLVLISWSLHYIEGGYYFRAISFIGSLLYIVTLTLASKREFLHSLHQQSPLSMWLFIFRGAKHSWLIKVCSGCRLQGPKNVYMTCGTVCKNSRCLNQDRRRTTQLRTPQRFPLFQVFILLVQNTQINALLLGTSTGIQCPHTWGSSLTRKSKTDSSL